MDKPPQQPYDATLKPELLVCRLFLLTNKRLLRGRKRFQKAKDELAIKGIDHFHFADLHKVLKLHGSAAQETESQIGAADV